MSDSADLPASIPPASGLPLTAVEDTALRIHACWNETGVYGDGSCRELPEFVHCRNCPVFSGAGAQLLNRALPPGYREQWTAHFALEQKKKESRSSSVVLFRVAFEWLALPTSCFQEIAERRPIHSLPHRRQGLALGLVNVRGELLTAVSLARLLGLGPTGSAERFPSHYHRLLVTHWEGSRFAFPVDEVHGPHRMHLEDFKTVPATLARSRPNYTQAILAWQDRTAGLLEPELLFFTLNRSLA